MQVTAQHNNATEKHNQTQTLCRWVAVRAGNRQHFSMRVGPSAAALTLRVRYGETSL